MLYDVDVFKYVKACYVMYVFKYVKVRYVMYVFKYVKACYVMFMCSSMLKYVMRGLCVQVC